MTGNYIVITRPLEEEKEFSDKLKKIGLRVFSYPTIKISPNQLSEKNKKIIHEKNFDWVIFTSKNGVIFFIETLKKLQISDFFENSKKIAVVGPETQKAAKKFKLIVDFIPSKFTTEGLAVELPNPKDQDILLPRANIASDTLTKLLEKRGANVKNIPIYKTELLKNPNLNFEKLLMANQISFLTFTSPSTVKGFMNSLSKQSKQLANSIPALVIGPVTASSARKSGFKTVIMADEYTTDGIVLKLQQIV